MNAGSNGPQQPFQMSSAHWPASSPAACRWLLNTFRGLTMNAMLYKGHVCPACERKKEEAQAFAEEESNCIDEFELREDHGHWHIFVPEDI
jgi:hypothetical protein